MLDAKCFLIQRLNIWFNLVDNDFDDDGASTNMKCVLSIFIDFNVM